MKYLPLFELEVNHAFYNNGHGQDFTIKASAETQQILKNHRSIAKATPNGGLRIVTTVTDSGEPFINYNADTILRFELQLDNPEFALITDPLDIVSSPSVLYSNVTIMDGAVKTLPVITMQEWSQETIVITTPSENEQFILSGKPRADVDKSNFTITTNGVTADIVSYATQNKILTLDSRTATPGQKISIKYPVTPSMPKGVYTYIDIHMNESLPDLSHPTKEPRKFQISFRAKQARWAYYYVTDMEHLDTAYKIVDNPPDIEGPPLVFSTKNRRNLVSDPDPLDEKSVELANRYPNLKRYRFLSDMPVTCSQAGRKYLSLQVDGNSLLKGLPNPSFKNYSIGRVMSGNSVTQQDWLFEVVKIVTK